MGRQSDKIYFVFDYTEGVFNVFRVLTAVIRCCTQKRKVDNRVNDICGNCRVNNIFTNYFFLKEIGIKG